MSGLNRTRSISYSVNAYDVHRSCECTSDLKKMLSTPIDFIQLDINTVRACYYCTLVNFSQCRLQLVCLPFYMMVVQLFPTAI